jgi:hypothetical protein
MHLYLMHLESSEETIHKGYDILLNLHGIKERNGIFHTKHQLFSVANTDEVHCKYKNPTTFSVIFGS